MVEIFPVVLRHETERAEQRRAEVVVISISIVRILAGFNADVVRRTAKCLRIVALCKQTNNSTQHETAWLCQFLCIVRRASYRKAWSELRITVK